MVVHRLRGYVAFALNVKGYVLQHVAFLLYQDHKGPAKSLKKQKNPLPPGLLSPGQWVNCLDL